MASGTNAILNFDDICSQVADNIHDTTTATNNKIKKWVNEIYHIICNSSMFTWLRDSDTFDTTSATTFENALYELADDVDHIFAVHQRTSPTKLTMVTMRDFREIVPNPTATGNPKYYIPYGLSSRGNKQIYLYPIPSSAITIRYDFSVRPDYLEATTDVPLVPINYRWIIVDGATALALRWQNDFQGYQIMWGHFQQQLADLIRSDRKRPDYQPVMRSRDIRTRRFLKMGDHYPLV